jgi:predicted nucleic acid-binding protein
VKFWDSSALVPLCVDERATAALRRLAQEDPAICAWWGSAVECASAIARLERDELLDAAGADAAFRRLDDLQQSWIEVEPVTEVRDVARRLLRVHHLRAADALQIAAAHLAAERRPATLDVVTLDDRLAAAAAKEGFRLTALPPTAP